jgi:hypothetical protein
VASAGVADVAEGAAILAASEDVSVLSAMVGLMSVEDLDHGLELARLSGELQAVGQVINLLQMPVLSAFLAARGGRLQEMAVEQIRQSGSTHSLARALTATGQKIAGMGENEIVEGIARLAVSEGMAERSALLSTEGALLAAKGMEQMVAAGELDLAARAAAAEGAADIAEGSTALGGAAAAAAFASDLEEKAR